MRANNEAARNVELVLAQIDALPPLSPVASRLAALTDASGGDAGRIVDLLAAAATLPARVFSILGYPAGWPMSESGWPMSSGHGGADDACREDSIIVSPTSKGGGPPDSKGGVPPDLDEAVRLYGAGAVRQIALALLVADTLAGGETSPTSDATVADPAALHRHGLATAFASQGIAAALNTSTPPAEAFACGLLHDLGKLAIRAALPKSFERIVLTCERTPADIAGVERELLGIDHTGVGRHLAVRWGLPRRWVECIWLHHQSPEALPASVAEAGHVQIVQLADTIAREQRLGYSGTRAEAASSHTLAEQLGLPDADRLRIIESLPAHLERHASLAGHEKGEPAGDGRSALDVAGRQPTPSDVETHERTARLERKADYLRALHALNRRLSPRAAIREVCSAAAAAVREALSVSASVVFVTSEDGCWVEEALCDGPSHIVSEPRRLDPPADSPTADTTADLTPIPPAFAPIVDRYRGRLGDDPVWLLPIVVDGRCVGGALFTATAPRAAALRVESDEIEALAAAIGLALAQAGARAAAVALGDELADVSRRLAAMQDELLQGRTLQRVVAIAAGAAHELNNPLAVISGRAQLLRRQADSEEVRNIADAIAAGATVCSDIVTELMDFARSSEPRPEAVELRPFIEALTAELVSDGLLAAGELGVAIASDTPPIWFDRTHLERLFAALFTNAIEATDPTARRLTVKAARHLTEDCVAVDVIDNGRGMTADVLSRAMDPFFSRRPAGRGRGLGLARVERWLQQGGGTIRIDSDPNRGTHVRLQLPGVPAAGG